MKKKLLFFLFISIIIVTALPAQTLDKKTTQTISDYFSNYTPDDNMKIGRCALRKSRNNIILNKKNRTVTIYANANFGYQLFTPSLNRKIYGGIKELLPPSLKNYKITVYINDKTIDELIPNQYREKAIDKRRLWGKIEYGEEPWVVRRSKPCEVTRGLQNRHISVWQSHGRFMKNEENRWKWQRPNLFCTNEDLFTQSFVVPFLIPMLENAGAIVYTPRERDRQKNEVLVDNDGSSLFRSVYREESDKTGAWKRCETAGFGFLQESYTDGENPFHEGTARYAETDGGEKKASATARWIPDIPCTGDYAVYVSYQSTRRSNPRTKYQVIHKGGISTFEVNQRMGGGTWVYLGTFHFEKGINDGQMVVLSNEGKEGEIVSADAVRFGGGMGCIVRGDSLQLSGMPRYLEGARYSVQFAGFPYSVYSSSNGENDYVDDINCRSRTVNYLAGGSVYNPDSIGLGVPIELSLGFHSDAGYSAEDDYIGTLGIVTTDYNDRILPVGVSRYASRDLADILLTCLKRDIPALHNTPWSIRGVWDKNYSESRLPTVPSMILESMSHQNFADMKMGHNPNFKFNFARAVYKSILQYVSYQHGKSYTVQPLPVKDFRIEFNHRKENSLEVSWNPVADVLEPSADPTEYILYTRIEDGGFDDGTRIKDNVCIVNIVPNVIYSFKVTAVNKGGESFPSEILSACKSDSIAIPLLIVNNFHRLSGPYSFRNEKEEGFDMQTDPGVPYRYTSSYCGKQLVFNRSSIGKEDGLGFSGSEWEGMLMAGNTFDYPYLHGKAMAAQHRSFVSCSSDAVQSGLVELSRYPMVDLIMGLEKEEAEQGASFNCAYPYKTFSPAMQEQIADYCKGGGCLFLSGAYIASDMIKTESERHFIRETLKYDYAGSNTRQNENIIFGSNLTMTIPRSLNEESCAVPCPDILTPVAPAFVAFVYNDSRQSAGIAYNGAYRLLATAFPFESIQDETQRNRLMGAILKFLNP